MCRRQVPPRPDQKRHRALRSTAQRPTDCLDGGAVIRHLTRPHSRPQRQRRGRSRCLPHMHAMIVEPNRRADDAAVAQILLRPQQTIHLHRDQTAQWKPRTITHIARVAPLLLIVNPRPAFAFIHQIGPTRVVVVVVKLPGKETILIHHVGEAFLRRCLVLAIAVPAILLAHHVHRLHAERFANVGLGRQVVWRAKFPTQMEMSKRVRFVRCPFMHEILQVVEHAERLALGILKDDLPLLTREFHDVLLRCTRLRCFQRVRHVLRQALQRIVLPIHVVEQDARLAVLALKTIHDPAHREDRQLPRRSLASIRPVENASQLDSAIPVQVAQGVPADPAHTWKVAIIEERWLRNRGVTLRLGHDHRPSDRIHLIGGIVFVARPGTRLTVALARIWATLVGRPTHLDHVSPVRRINGDRRLHMQHGFLCSGRGKPQPLQRRPLHICLHRVAIRNETHLPRLNIGLQHLAKHRLRLRRTKRRRPVNGKPRHRRPIFLCVHRLNPIHQLLEQPAAMEGPFHRMPVRCPAHFADALVLVHAHQRLLCVLPAEPLTVVNNRDGFHIHPRRLNRRRPTGLGAPDNEKVRLEILNRPLGEIHPREGNESYELTGKRHPTSSFPDSLAFHRSFQRETDTKRHRLTRKIRRSFDNRVLSPVAFQ